MSGSEIEERAQRAKTKPREPEVTFPLKDLCFTEPGAPPPFALPACPEKSETLRIRLGAPPEEGTSEFGPLKVRFAEERTAPQTTEIDKVRQEAKYIRGWLKQRGFLAEADQFGYEPTARTLTATDSQTLLKRYFGLKEDRELTPRLVEEFLSANPEFRGVFTKDLSAVSVAEGTVINLGGSIVGLRHHRAAAERNIREIRLALGSEELSAEERTRAVELLAASREQLKRAEAAITQKKLFRRLGQEEDGAASASAEKMKERALGLESTVRAELAAIPEGQREGLRQEVAFAQARLLLAASEKARRESAGTVSDNLLERVLTVTDRIIASPSSSPQTIQKAHLLRAEAYAQLADQTQPPAALLAKLPRGEMVRHWDLPPEQRAAVDAELKKIEQNFSRVREEYQRAGMKMDPAFEAALHEKQRIVRASFFESLNDAAAQELELARLVGEQIGLDRTFGEGLVRAREKQNIDTATGEKGGSWWRAKSLEFLTQPERARFAAGLSKRLSALDGEQREALSRRLALELETAQDLALRQNDLGRANRYRELVGVVAAASQNKDVKLIAQMAEARVFADVGAQEKALERLQEVRKATAPQSRIHTQAAFLEASLHLALSRRNVSHAQAITALRKESEAEKHSPALSAQLVAQEARAYLLAAEPKKALEALERLRDSRYRAVRLTSGGREVPAAEYAQQFVRENTQADLRLGPVTISGRRVASLKETLAQLVTKETLVSNTVTFSLAGAGSGAILGAGVGALGGPAAPVTVGGGALIGAGAGGVAGGVAGLANKARKYDARAVREAFETGLSTTDWREAVFYSLALGTDVIGTVVAPLKGARYVWRTGLLATGVSLDEGAKIAARELAHGAGRRALSAQELDEAAGSLLARNALKAEPLPGVKLLHLDSVRTVNDLIVANAAQASWQAGGRVLGAVGLGQLGYTAQETFRRDGFEGRAVGELAQTAAVVGSLAAANAVGQRFLLARAFRGSVSTPAMVQPRTEGVSTQAPTVQVIRAEAGGDAGALMGDLPLNVVPPETVRVRPRDDFGARKEHVETLRLHLADTSDELAKQQRALGELADAPPSPEVQRVRQMIAENLSRKEQLRLHLADELSRIDDTVARGAETPAARSPEIAQGGAGALAQAEQTPSPAPKVEEQGGPIPAQTLRQTETGVTPAADVRQRPTVELQDEAMVFDKVREAARREDGRPALPADLRRATERKREEGGITRSELESYLMVSVRRFVDSSGASWREFRKAVSEASEDNLVRMLNSSNPELSPFARAVQGAVKASPSGEDFRFDVFMERALQRVDSAVSTRPRSRKEQLTTRANIGIRESAETPTAKATEIEQGSGGAREKADGSASPEPRVEASADENRPLMQQTETARAPEINQTATLELSGEEVAFNKVSEAARRDSSRPVSRADLRRALEKSPEEGGVTREEVRTYLLSAIRRYVNSSEESWQSFKSDVVKNRQDIFRERLSRSHPELSDFAREVKDAVGHSTTRENFPYDDFIANALRQVESAAEKEPPWRGPVHRDSVGNGGVHERPTTKGPQKVVPFEPKDKKAGS